MEHTSPVGSSDTPHNSQSSPDQQPRTDLCLVAGDIRFQLHQFDSWTAEIDSWEVGLFYQDLATNRWKIQLASHSILRRADGSTFMGYGVAHTAQTGVELLPTDIIIYRHLPGTKAPFPARHHQKIYLEFTEQDSS